MDEAMVVDAEQEAKMTTLNVTEALKKAEDEFNQLAQKIREIDEQMKKTTDTLQAEKNKAYTRAVEVQGLIKFLQSQVK